MWFNIIVGNHGGTAGIIGLYPLITYTRSMLSLCGHEVTVDYNPSPGPINLYYENFEGAKWAKVFRDLRSNHGLKIGVVATELMVNVGGRTEIPYSKHGIVYAFPDAKREHIELRIEGFDAILGEIDFLWPLMQRTADGYRSRTRVCEFLPFGSVGEVPDDVRRSPKDIDVLFIGKNTPHRTKVLQMMAEKGVAVVPIGHGFQSGWLAPALVESMLDRTKIGLNLTLHGTEDDNLGVDPRFASCQRIVDMLSRNICVVSEEIPLDNPYSEFMVSSEAECLADLCEKMLAGKTWVDVGAARAAAFHAAMDVREICQPVIERTLAALV